MKYSEVCSDKIPTNRYDDTHPVLAAIKVRAIKWGDFQRMIACSDIAKLVSSSSHDGRMLAWIACLHSEVAEALEDEWTT